MYAIACLRFYVEVLALFPLRNVFPPTIFIQFVLHTSHRNIHV